MNTEPMQATTEPAPTPRVVGGVPGGGENPLHRRRGPGGCFWVAIGLVAALGLAALGIAALSAAGIMAAFGESGMGATSRSVRTHGVDELPQFREIWSSGQGETKVVRIPLNGLIFFGDAGWRAGGTGSADTALRSIRRATLDPEVRGILLEIDSGGGGITASDILHKALKDFQQAQPGRRVVTLMGDVAASGGYYVAAASDRIVAHPTTLTGSIGVLIQSVNLHELASNIGVRGVTIKSGDQKDLLNPLETLPEPQRRLLQKLVDDLHQRFLRIVSVSRNLTLDETAALADGRVFLAEEARALRLIDTIGYHADAVQTLAGLLDEENLYVVRYEQEFSLRDLFGRPGWFGLRLQDLLPDTNARLMYRWNL